MTVSMHTPSKIIDAHSEHIDPISLEPIPPKYMVKLQDTYHDARFMAMYAIATKACMHPYTRQVLDPEECDAIGAALDDLEQMIAFENVKLEFMNDTIRTLLAMQRTVAFLSLYTLLISQAEDELVALTIAMQQSRFVKRDVIKACLNTYSSNVKKALIHSIRAGDQYVMTKVAPEETFRILEHECFDSLVLLIDDYSQAHDYHL